MLFSRLYELAKGVPLTMLITANVSAGKLTVTVLPKPEDEGGETALRTPLSLSATPEELDAGFVGALESYTEARTSLAEQVNATTEVLKAATSAQANKGAAAIRKAAKPAAPAAPPQRPDSSGAEYHDDPDDAETPTAAPAESSDGPDQQVSLFS